MFNFSCCEVASCSECQSAEFVTHNSMCSLQLHSICEVVDSFQVFVVLCRQVELENY